MGERKTQGTLSTTVELTGKAGITELAWAIEGVAVVVEYSVARNGDIVVDTVEADMTCVCNVLSVAEMEMLRVECSDDSYDVEYDEEDYKLMRDEHAHELYAELGH